MQTMISRRALLEAATCAGTAVLCLAGCQGKTVNQPSEGRVEVSDRAASQDSAADVTSTAIDGMPFSLDGVPSEGDVLQAQGTQDPTALGSEWSFGGDYTQIGSFPIDQSTVFGSAAEDANDVTSYVAALITANEMTELEQRQDPSSERFFEPQDGSGSADLIVWRCSELSNLPTTGTDNWQLRTWDAASGQTRVIASAQQLNGRTDTPMLDAEVVPTTDGSHVFFASMHLEQDSWEPVVLSCELDGSSQPQILGQGNYPAAMGKGALWACSEDSQTGLCTQLMRWDSTTSSRVFSVVSDGYWGISGVWARGGITAVGFSSTDAAQGSYVGTWQDDFSNLVCWLYTYAPRVVGGINDSWFVWGVGSEADNADMFALNYGSKQILFLGNAAGYSRPSIARDTNAVMVPVVHGSDAVRFRVGLLG